MTTKLDHAVALGKMTDAELMPSHPVKAVNIVQIYAENLRLRAMLAAAVEELEAGVRCFTGVKKNQMSKYDIDLCMEQMEKSCLQVLAVAKPMVEGK